MAQDNVRECYDRTYRTRTGQTEIVRGGGLFGITRPLVRVRRRRCLAFSGTTVLVNYSQRCVCGLMTVNGLGTSHVDGHVTFVHETSVRRVLRNGPCRHVLPNGASAPEGSSSSSLPTGERGERGRDRRILSFCSNRRIVSLFGMGRS